MNTNMWNESKLNNRDTCTASGESTSVSIDCYLPILFLNNPSRKYRSSIPSLSTLISYGVLGSNLLSMHPVATYLPHKWMLVFAEILANGVRIIGVRNSTTRNQHSRE